MTSRAGVAVAAGLTLATVPACSATQLAWYGHTPDRRLLVEVVQRGDAQWLEVGARTSRPYRAIAPDHIAFAPDGRRLAFAAKVHERPEQWTIVADFIEGQAWDGVAGVRFGPHGSRLVYAALDRGQWRMVVDGIPGPPHEEVDSESVVFSPDGRRVGYVARDGGCERTVIDDHVGDCAALVVGLALGDVATRDVVVVADRTDGGDAHVVVGGGRVLDVSRASALAVDLAVLHWAVVAQSPSGWHVIADGLDGEPFDEIGRVIWAPDGRGMAYAARRHREWHIVVGNRASTPYAEVEDPVFAANGSHLGYVARDPRRSVVVIDGQPIWECDAPATALTFSDDGSHRGWVYRAGAETMIAVDDRRYAFEVVVERTLQFSHDGQHWAALVGSLAQQQLFVTVDGHHRLAFDAEELFGGLQANAAARLDSWVSAELELYLARVGGRS